MTEPVRVREVSTEMERYTFRTPLKFGGVPISFQVGVTARVRVETKAGKSAWGTGSMPLGNVWSYPTKKVPADQTLKAMELMAGKILKKWTDIDAYAHPVELGHLFEPEIFKICEETTKELGLADPVPRLCGLVTGSSFDAAIHDAYGRLYGRHVYECYGKDWLPHDLSRYLDDRFKGEYLDKYVLEKPKPRMPQYHLIGALDALTDGDVKERLNDGLPNTLGEWIAKDQLTHLKIKLNGNDAQWDMNRILSIDKVTGEAQAKRSVSKWVYSLDFNEQCPNVEYLLEVLNTLKEKSAATFDRIAYVEQPTKRDLKAHPENKMHKAAEIKPVVIDESLVDYETLLLAREQGYSGAALKSCKGQGQSMIMAAAAQKFDMFLCVQDLTCPGLAFMQSAGLAAHIGPVTAIEGNARQYCPLANAEGAARHPGLFTILDGHIDTSLLSGVGLTA